jgi:WXG100 family type VII secretion target
MSALRVTPDQLTQLSATVTGTAGETHEAHVRLRGQLAPLFGADWSGQAAAQFTQLYTQFDQSATALSTALQGIGQLLRGAGNAYEQTEVQVAGSFRG